MASIKKNEILQNAVEKLRYDVEIKEVMKIYKKRLKEFTQTKGTK